MTSLVETKPVTVVDEINEVYTHIDSNVSYNKSRVRKHILKSKENTYKHKCNKLLKKKLKKYKLRQDGTEDQDVLDVSKILLSSLIIKSPSSVKDSEESDINYFEELRPRNYLFKMVRRKAIKISVKSPNLNIKENDKIEMPEAISSQERKHTNAFQLLMDSRNKSIGSNSPGKERNNESESEEIIEKKNNKVKRNLALQKMAEAKGSLKHKELEEQQDNLIKKKMDKRAERLKNMILKETKPAKLNEDTNIPQVKEIVSPNLNLKDKSDITNKNGVKKLSKAWKIVDIFNTMDDPVNLNPEKKHIPKEDSEFLKKLSPSMKKKESMLSYFKKVDKDSESPVDSENDNLIKVKLQLKTKKRGRKKKLSLKRDTIDLCDTTEVNDENNEVVGNTKILLPDVVPIEENSESNCVVERQKRKRISKMDKVNSAEVENIAANNESRPKRSIKKPVKYDDDAFFSSSEDDLHIFTPKKKKHDNDKVISSHKSKKAGTETHKTKVDIVTVRAKVDEESVKLKVEKKEVKDSIPKKPVKLAPIFAAKQLDAAALEAKQKFLQSGVPDKLKKIIQQQKSIDKISDDFLVVTHVQQKELVVEEKCEQFFNLFEEVEDDHVYSITYEGNAIQKLLDPHKVTTIDCTDKFKKSTQAILQNIKQLYPKFPVYRTYRCLRGKRKGEFKDYNNIDVDNSIEVMNDVVDVVSDSPDKLNWTDKYKATSTKQIIGNFESIKELRKWLVSWSENEIKANSKTNPDSDSDFYQSDTDSRESLKTTNNLLILTGPTGCGKTSSVYAVASELAMKVIEVNASSKRTGKIMLQDLQEATQSHKVNRGTSNSQTDNSQRSSQEKSLTELLKNNKKRGRPKKLVEQPTNKSLEKIEVLNSTPSSQESCRTDMSLILIDDADIVFDQDDGFSSAIVQLVQCSKRPVILITSSLMCPHLQRFLQNGKILKMCPLLPRLLGTWLDIMCLADSGIGWPGVGAKFLNYFEGDIRKTINYLQFYIASYAHTNSEEETASQHVDCYKPNIDDESSSMSWADNEDLEGRKLTPHSCNGVESNFMWTDFIEKHSNMSSCQYPMQLFNFWWSIPRLLSVPNVARTIQNINKLKIIEFKELEVMADVAEAISLSDFITQSGQNSYLEISSHPWYSAESDSVSEEDYINEYTNKYEVGDDICNALVKGCVAAAQDVLYCDRKANISFPGMSLQREKDKIISRHNSLTSYLNPWATLDRRSLALDYWSSCRTICRLEKNKNNTNLNTKRNNRFCHYLKSLNVLCKSDTFDNLCHSLSGEGTQINITNFNE